MKDLACALLFAAVLAAQPPPCAIGGTVADALTKQPLGRTQVFAEIDSDSDDDSTPPVRRITDANGAFCFENLTPGSYHVRASRAFYLNATYGEHWPGDSGDDVEVSAGKSGPPITISLTPQATISGVLVDADGDPLGGARIELLKKRWKGRKLTTASVQKETTDNEGRYHFGKLAAGTYYISAVPLLGREDGPQSWLQLLDQTRQSFQQVEGKTYYQDSILFRDATPIRVSAGQEIRDLTLTLRATEARRVSGQVAPDALNTSPRVLYFLEDVGTNFVTRRTVPIQDDGRFLVDGLFPDHYLVQGPGVVSKEIDLTSGDIENLALEPNLPIEIQIAVHFQDANTHASFRDLTLLDKMPDSAEYEYTDSVSAQFVSENKFKVVVHPGQYEIRLGGDADSYFIKSLTIDGEPQLRPNILDLKPGAQKSVELFLSSNTASVEGRVTADHPIEEGATLLLEDQSDPESLLTKLSGPNGEFQWTLLQAGKYRLYAFEEFNRDLWGNPDLAALLAAQSVVLEVEEGRHLRVSVPLISTEDFQAALKKASF